jgi:hypothetical protein
MTEKLKTEQRGFQVWKNPQSPEGIVCYLGEFYPPSARCILTGNDLRELGCAPGSYTIGAPPDEAPSHQFEKWVTVVVTE